MKRTKFCYTSCVANVLMYDWFTSANSYSNQPYFFLHFSRLHFEEVLRGTKLSFSICDYKDNKVIYKRYECILMCKNANI